MEVVYFVLPLRVVAVSFIFLVIFIPRRERLNTSVADVAVCVVVLSAAIADQCRIRLASTLQCVFVVANLVAERWAISYSSVRTASCSEHPPLWRRPGSWSADQGICHSPMCGSRSCVICSRSGDLVLGVVRRVEGLKL